MQEVSQQPDETSLPEIPVKRYHANKKYKDRVFSAIFGNPEHNDWTLALYNAVNNSHYTNPDDIQFNTVDNALFLGIHNHTQRCFLYVYNSI